MKPAMDPGDVIFIKKINVDNLKAGDIITFQKEEFIATHRIIKFEDKSIITQGDNNNLADDPLTKENVIGKYMFKVPKIGYFYSFVGSPIGIIVISIIIVIIIIYEICFVDDKKEKKNPSEEERDQEIWLKDNAYKFGFIIRYPKQKEDATGKRYQPYTLRYVGKEIAKKLHDEGYVLDEVNISDLKE